MADVVHNTLTGIELHEPYHYVQAADPGAVGAGKYWLDTTVATAPVLKRRNGADAAWITLFDAANVATLAAHVANVSNPHSVTKAQVGLGNVPNTDATARANHTGTQSADTLTDGATNKAFLATERTKLTGIAAGATANATDAQLRDRTTHTGTQTLDTTTDTASRVAMTPAERTKLSGVATGATANATDAALRDRSTHTGTQDAATIGSGLLDPNRLGAGGPTSAKVLYGDQTWRDPATAAVGEGENEATVLLIDDFVFGGATSGNVGELNWLSSANVSAVDPPDDQTQGLIELATAGNANQVRALTSQGKAPFARDYDATFRVRLGATIASAEYRVGLMDAATGQPASGLYFERLSADATWFFVARSGVTQTRTNTGVTAVALQMVKLRLRKAATTVFFSVDGGAEGSVGTNVPSTGLGVYAMQVKTLVNSSRAIQADYFRSLATGFAR